MTKLMVSLLLLLALGLISMGVRVQFLSSRSQSIVTPTNPPLNDRLLQKPVELDANKLFALVNQWRDSEGRSTYRENEHTCNVAEIRLSEARETFSHEGFEAGRFCTKDCWMGENLSKGLFTEEETLEAWLQSPTHRDVLERDYTYACVRCSETYCVQIFAHY